MWLLIERLTVNEKMKPGKLRRTEILIASLSYQTIGLSKVVSKNHKM